MKTRFNAWTTLAKGVLLESIRRKDLYVVAILGLLITAGAGMVGFFGVKGIEVFAKDLGFGVISLFSTLLCVMISARQLPEEIKQRTLYPMLARPITRFDFLFGKFLGAYLVSALAFLMLAGVNCGAMLCFKLPLGAIALQYVLLKLIGLWMLTALTFALSLLMTPAATVTLGLLLSFGGSAISRAMDLGQGSVSPALKPVANALYFALPHIDLFDLGKKAAYGWPCVPLWVVGALLAYSVCYSTAMLVLGWARFERQAV